MNGLKRITGVVMLITLIVSVLIVPQHASAKSFFEKTGAEITAGVFTSIKNFFSSLFSSEHPPTPSLSKEGENATPVLKPRVVETPSTQTPPSAPSYTPPSPPLDQGEGARGTARAGGVNVVKVEATPQLVKQYVTQPGGLTEAQFVKSLQLLEERLTGQINAKTSTSNGNYTVPPNINLQALTPTTITGGTLSNIASIAVTGDSTFSSALTLSQISAPSDTSNKLYNTSGDLYWAGNLIGGATTGVWNSDGTNVYRTSGKVGIGTSSPMYPLSIHVTPPNGISPSMILSTLAHNTILQLDSSAAGPNGEEIWFGTGGARKWHIKRSGSTNAFEIVESGVANRIGLLPGGNFGIGTTSPYAKLAITSTVAASTTMALRPQASQTGNILDIYSKAGVLTSVIDANHNWGIGTSSPATKLSVLDSTNITIFTGNNAQGLRIGGAGTGAFSLLQFSGDRNVPIAQIGALQNNSTGTSLYFGTSNNYTTGITNAAMVITPGGDIGVGLSVPGSIAGSTYLGHFLHLKDTSKLSRLVSEGTQGQILLVDTDAATDKKVWNIASSDGDLTFYQLADNGATASSRLTFKDGGNVGIGTTNPSDGRVVAVQANNAAFVARSSADGGDGGTNVTALRSTDLDSSHWANARYDAYSHAFGYGGSAQLDTAMLINGSGSVGIGTTTPSAKLSITGAGTGTGRVFAIADSGNAEKFTVLDNGNVGIGTSSPQEKLHLTGNIRIEGSAGTVVGSGAYLDFKRSTDNWNPARIEQIWENNGMRSSLTFQTNGATVGTLTEKMRVTGDGSVGIGTTTPQGKLSVVGGPTILSAAGDTQSALRLLKPSGGGTNYWDFSINGNTRLDLGTEQGSKVTFTYGGNVGIGTTSPSHKLTVQGGVCVTAGAACTAEVAGTIIADGVITQNAFDIAEVYETTDSSISAGDIVAVDTNTDLGIVKATQGSAIMGIVSTKPGFTLGDAKKGKPVALAGRVPVKFSTENGEVKRGDSLTVSSQAGVAKKANTGDYVIGTALENQANNGMVTVFVRSGFQNSISQGLATSSTAQVQIIDNSSIIDTFKFSVVAFKDVIADTVRATVAYFKHVETDTIAVNKGLEMKDELTGETYCVKIKGGDWSKEKGACVTPIVPTPSVPEATAVEVVTPEATTTPEVIIEPVPQAPAAEEESKEEEVVITDATQEISGE